MDSGSGCFGSYLKELIKAAGMTQTEFYTRLGITKPYFYDILSGKVSPPPPDKQFEILKVLNIQDETTRRRFLNIAADGRGEIPADIVKLIQDHPNDLDNIRNGLNKLLAAKR